MNYTITVNGRQHTVDCDDDTPLLWVLREELGLTGTKFGCGMADCGACTVLVDGAPEKSCVFRIKKVGASAITTCEGLAEETRAGHAYAKTAAAVTQAWSDCNVAQCGYCQPAQFLTAVALLEEKPAPTDQEIKDGMTCYCRCGTYGAMRRAVALAAKLKAETP